ncbi:hypothetical protein MMC25_001630 [Agyrium rufum]|nr:hypothetical protein [Agyrium rufum]
MFFQSRHLSILFLASLVSSSPFPGIKDYLEARKAAPPPASAPKALYFISNNAENAIVALSVGKDGMLGAGTITPTGGKGSNEVTVTNGTAVPNTPDALASQGSVRLVGNLIFAINPGSSDLSVFAMNPKNPLSLIQLGKPRPTNGDFPVTLGVSEKNSLVCVGNSGALSGISCAKFCSSTGLGDFDALRPFNLGQTTPPSGPFNGIADSFFSEDESMLITTVKGNMPSANGSAASFPGFMSVFPVNAGNGVTGPQLGSASTEVRTSPPGTGVLFGTVPIPGAKDNALFVTDALFGAGIMTISGKSKAAALTARTPIAGQMATCWVTISLVSKTAFVTDVAVNSLTEMDLSTGKIIKHYLLTNGNFGMTDLESGGNFIYALSVAVPEKQAATMVTVFDVSGGPGTAKQIQNYEIGMGVIGNAQGMQVLMR